MHSGYWLRDKWSTTRSHTKDIWFRCSIAYILKSTKYICKYKDSRYALESGFYDLSESAENKEIPNVVINHGFHVIKTMMTMTRLMHRGRGTPSPESHLCTHVNCQHLQHSLEFHICTSARPTNTSIWHFWESFPFSWAQMVCVKETHCSDCSLDGNNQVHLL